MLAAPFAGDPIAGMHRRCVGPTGAGPMGARGTRHGERHPSAQLVALPTLLGIPSEAVPMSDESQRSFSIARVLLLAVPLAIVAYLGTRQYRGQVQAGAKQQQIETTVPPIVGLTCDESQAE